MFETLQAIFARPEPFSVYTARDLWTDEHTSAQMLKYHLNAEVDLSSRRHAFIERSVEWMVPRFDLAEGARVADFGCGPGLYANRLARRGARVTGIDFSARSLEHARGVAQGEGLDVEYVHGDYLDFETDARFRLVIMIMCDFCVLSPEQRARMLRKFRGLLEPGGRVLLDVSSLVSFAQRQEASLCEPNHLDGFWSPDPYYTFVNTFLYPSERVALDQYTIVEQRRTRTVYNWFQYFDPEGLRGEFERCGLEVEETLGDVAGAPYDPAAPEFAVIAKRV